MATLVADDIVVALRYFIEDSEGELTQLDGKKLEVLLRRLTSISLLERTALVTSCGRIPELVRDLPTRPAKKKHLNEIARSFADAEGLSYSIGRWVTRAWASALGIEVPTRRGHIGDSGEVTADGDDSASADDTPAASSSALAGKDPLVVDPDGNGDFSNLEDALRVSRDGATIVLKRGEYQSCKIARSVTIVSEQPAQPAVISADGGATVHIRGRFDVVLRHLLIRGGQYAGVEIDGRSNVTIDNCTLFDNGYAAVWAANGASLVVRNSQVHRCEKDGLQVVMNSKALIEECRVSKCGRIGIRVNDKSTATIRNCDVREAHFGVYVEFASSAILEDSTVCKNVIGIALRTGKKCEVRRCEISENTEVGLETGQPKHLLEDNRVFGNGKADFS
jgi:hypothetical protein